jgi:hypothetical protein
MEMTPKQLVEEIDAMFDRASENGWNRMSLDWSIWSAELNRGIRARIEGGDPDSFVLRYVFIYWAVVSQLLDLNKNYILTRKKYEAKQEERYALRKMILQNEVPYDINVERNDFFRLVEGFFFENRVG